MQLNHRFRYTCKDWENLLAGVNTVADLVSNIAAYAVASVPPIFKADEYTKLISKYEGDAFEVFGEYFIKSHGSSSEVGIVDYQPLYQLGNTDKDTGVDGYGTGTNCKPATVQFKFKKNRTAVLSANEDRLTNFTWTSVRKFKVDVEDSSNMLIVSTGKELASFTKHDMLDDAVRFLGFNELSKMLDHNIVFWDGFRASTMLISAGDNC